MDLTDLTAKFNALLEVNESYQIPDALMSALFDNERKNKLFDLIKLSEKNVLRDIYQTEHGDRDKFKQDFTPDCVVDIVKGISPKSTTVADICAGTGALTIGLQDNNAEFITFELSERAIPFLLCSMSAENLKGQVIVGDVLKQEYKKAYKLLPGSKYSDIEQIAVPEFEKQELIVMNPPYSKSWERPNNDVRFNLLGLAPKSKADYAFVLHGLYYLKDKGTLIALLPSGVLFRGQSEQTIRKSLIENNLIDAVIGLPQNLFLNTGIPIVLLVLKKGRNQEDILFINAEKDFIKQSKQNYMDESHIQKLVNTYNNRLNCDKYSRVVKVEEIIENEYNLNLPRYIDNTEPEPIPDLSETLTSLIEVEKEIGSTKNELAKMINDITGYTSQEKELLDKWISA